MRKIDKFLGIPLCFLFTIIEKLRINKKHKSPPEKILITQISEMGSQIMTYPSLDKLKRKYINSELYFLTFKKNNWPMKILKVIPEKNILTIRDDSIIYFFIDVLKIIIKARRIKIDAVIDLELFARVSMLLNYLTGAKTRIGFDNFMAEGLYRGNLLTHKVYYNPYKHISINFLALINSLGEDKKDLPLVKEEIKNNLEIPKIEIKKGDKEKILKKLQKKNSSINEKSKLMIFNYYAGDLLIRAWQLKNFSELGRRLLEEKENYIILIGTKKSKKFASIVKKGINSERCIDLSGETSLDELINLFSISEIMIGIDNGPSNFSALTRLKTIVLFGPETPLLYKPLNENVKVIYKNFNCSPCLTAFNHRTSPCKNNKCLKNISVDEVYKEVKNML